MGLTTGLRTLTDTNRDGVRVAPGQRWVSLDKRRPARSCEVTKVEGGCATLLEFSRDRASEGMNALLRAGDPRAATWKPEPVKVSLERMHEHSTGWRLVDDGRAISQ